MADSLDFSTGSGKAIFEQYLQQFGFKPTPGFVDQAFNQWNSVRGNKDEFLFWLYGTDTYKNRFPYAADLRAKGIPFSEADAIQYGRNVRQLLHSVGAPEGFVTDAYINGLIAGDVNFNELESRITNNYADYLNAPEVVKQEFRNQVGDDSAVLAYYLDPSHTIQQLGEITAKALVRGYGKQAGLNIGDQAAQYAYGLSAQQVQQGVAQVAELQPLTRGTVAAPDQLSADQLAQATFTGVATKVRKAVEERDAAFSDAGGPSAVGVARGV